MVRPLARRSAVSTLAGLVSIAGLTLSAAHADAVDPYADAGTIVGWSTGAESYGSDQVPASLDGTVITQVDAGVGYTLALDSDGKVTCFGDSSGNSIPEICDLPASVTDGATKQVAAGQAKNAGAVLADGSVAVWGQSALKGAGDPDAPWPTKVPEALKQAGAATHLSIGDGAAAAVTSDGKVVTWGTIDDSTVPEDLKVAGAAQDVAVSAYGGVFVLRTDGSLEAFGGGIDVPADLQAPGSVKQVSAVFVGAYALTTTGKVVGLGYVSNDYANAPAAPAALDGKTVTTLGAHWGPSVAVTSDGDIVAWNCQAGFAPQECPAVPSSFSAADISAFATGGDTVIALSRVVLPVAKPTIAGTATVGQTLTGTPGTFSGGGTVTNQWLADGQPISGATGSTLVLAEAQKGSTISLRSTATKGDVTKTQTSDATTAVAAGPAALSSATLKVTKAPTTTKSGSASLSFKAAGGKAVNGKATLSLKKGSSTRTSTVTIKSGKGTATIAKLPVGTWSAKATFQGSTTVKSGSTSSTKVAVKAPISSAKVSLTKKPTSKARGKVSVTFKATGASVNGKAVVTLTKGRSVKKITLTVKNGKGSATVPRLAKGTWKYRAGFAGSSTVLKQSSGTHSVRITK